ncbi:MAG: hypothetical protein AAF685_18285 [Cyanobacteria bacterium P01_C01_bin.89]
MVLITASTRQHGQNFDIALCWSDVFQIIERWRKDNSDPSLFVFDDFLELIQEEGMGPPAPISSEAMRHYYASSNLKRTISELVRRILMRNWSTYIQKDYKKVMPGLQNGWNERYGYYPGQEHGKIGIQLLDGYYPGIYVGVDVDGDQYGFTPSHLDKGPDCCLILEFDESVHRQYLTNPNYAQLVKRLSGKVAALDDGWELYRCLADPTIDEYSRLGHHYWRPIYLRKPLLEVLAGAQTGEEQGDRFYDETNRLIKLVTEEDSFWQLRDDLG